MISAIPQSDHALEETPLQRYESIVKGGRLVIPFLGELRGDLGIREGRIVAIAEEIPASAGESVIDARGMMVFPGAVDSHYHVGIYRPHSEDAESESRSSLVGGVTALISYFRTGQNYLGTTGPYREIFPRVLALSDGHFYTDYAYHLAIMDSVQLDEIEMLVDDFGIASFKFYMFYKGLNLASDSTAGSAYTMAENYDLGHLYRMMERITAIAAQRRTAGRISLSLHCENPEIIRVFIEEVKRHGPGGLAGYSRSRPPLSERLSIHEAGVLADATGCPLNLLHLSSREALQAAMEIRTRYPQLDIVCETTLHHLALTCDTAGGIKGKVNPPLRTRADAEFLWQGIHSGRVDTVASDHACCQELDKDEDDLWRSLPGFGGSALLYPVLLSEGWHKRGIPPVRLAELAAANPARHFGLYPRKGTIAIGADADLALVDPGKTQRVHAAALHSAQEYSPFEGMELTGWPVATILRGQVQYKDGEVVGGKIGRYLKRPLPGE